MTIGMSQKTPNPVKRRMREAMQERGMQAKLAKLLGFERASISNMLDADGDPPLHYVKAVSDLTGRSVEYFLTGKEDVSIVREPLMTNAEVSMSRELSQLREEVARLKFEVEILRSALREIGAGRNGEISHVK